MAGTALLILRCFDFAVNDTLIRIILNSFKNTDFIFYHSERSEESNYLYFIKIDSSLSSE